MSVGDQYEEFIRFSKVSTLMQKCLKKFYSASGIHDFHTHVRINPLLDYVKNAGIDKKKILEIGCGAGINIFEMNKISNRYQWYIGVDLNRKAIINAKLICKKMHIEKTEFFNEDAFHFLENNLKYAEADIIILYDFLEHINNPHKFLCQLNNILLNKHDLIFIISVPTKMYKKVFGDKFNREVGHVMDGYDINMLDKLFKREGYHRIQKQYNTGIIGNIGAFLYYNLFGSMNSLFGIFLKSLITLPFRYIDINGPRVSSSLFAIYTKKD